MTDSIEGESETLFELFQNAPFSVYIIFLIAVCLLVISAVVSGSEVAFFSLSSTQISECRQASKGVNKKITKLLDDPKRLLATILIANNLVNVAIVTLCTYATWQIAGKDNELAILFLTFVVTAAIVFFGEIVPKVYANQWNLSFARFSAAFLGLLVEIFRPFSYILMQTGDYFDRRFERKGYDVSVRELHDAVEMTTPDEYTAEEKEILKGIVNFGTKSAKQIMQSRMDITAFDLKTDFHVMMDKINKSGYSRIPIFDETIDKIIGILYIKDILPFLDKDEKFEWQTLVNKEAFFIPEAKRIDELLRDFQEKRVHMAIVVDEYGGTSGLVTMEDIIEEIVGEINDEFDHDELVFRKIDDATFSFEGKTSLNDFCKIIDLNPEIFVDAKGESESLGGLLLELFGKLPNAGEHVEFKNFVFTAVSVNQKRIKGVRVLMKDRIRATPVAEAPEADQSGSQPLHLSS